MLAMVMAKPFLRCHHRFKNGPDHCSWSIAEKVRTARGWVQRHILYLGEINDSQREAWTKVTDVFDTAREQTRPLAQEGELLVLAESKDRVNKERSMRRRPLKGLGQRLQELAQMDLSRDPLLLKLGAAQHQYPAAWRWVAVAVAEESQPIAPPNFRFELRKDKLRQARRREGRHRLRSNLSAQEPEKLGPFYMQLTQVEAAFKDLKDDLSLRPIFHPLEERIEAHIFVSFLA
jgi:hypothetical protein